MRAGIVAIILMGLLPPPVVAQQGDTLARAPADTTSRSSPPVTEAYPGLLDRAKITPTAAVRAALAKVKRSEFASAIIEEHGRRLVYVIQVEEPSGQRREVLVDAETGRVLSNRKVRR